MPVRHLFFLFEKFFTSVSGVNIVTIEFTIGAAIMEGYGKCSWAGTIKSA